MIPLSPDLPTIVARVVVVGGGTFLPLATKKPNLPSWLLMLRWRILGRILDSVTVSPFVDIFVEFDRWNQKQLQIAS